MQCQSLNPKTLRWKSHCWRWLCGTCQDFAIRFLRAFINVIFRRHCIHNQNIRTQYNHTISSPKSQYPMQDDVEIDTKIFMSIGCVQKSRLISQTVHSPIAGTPGISNSRKSTRTSATKTQTNNRFKTLQVKREEAFLEGLKPNQRSVA